MSTPHAVSDQTAAQKRGKLLAAIQKIEGDVVDERPSPRQRIALAEAEFRLAVLPDTNVYDAIEHLRRAIDYDPFHPKLFFHLGRCLHTIGDYQGAVHRYRYALKLAPASRRTYAHLALCLIDMGTFEQEIGNDLLLAVLVGSDEDFETLMKDLDALMEAQRSSAVGSEQNVKMPPHKPMKHLKVSPPSKTPEPEDDDEQHRQAAAKRREDKLWRLVLISELLMKGVKPSVISTLLAHGKELPGDLAAITVLQLTNGLDPTKAHERLAQEPLKTAGDDPAIQLLQDTLALRTSEDRTAFVDQAVTFLDEGRLPLELVCVLHYEQCGAKSDVPIREALQLLDRYPAEVQQQPLFRELRIAILDGYARHYWQDQAYNRAALVWGEMIALDPHRIATEHNLAILAARTRNRDLYVSAWSRAAELRYIHAAVAGDPRVLLDERKTLHLSFHQQAIGRYAKNPAQLQDDELKAWLEDRAAVELWLQEWTLYYINARLSFQSPVHILGVARDADSAAITHAHETLAQMLDHALEQQPWTSIEPFRILARQVFDQAALDAEDDLLRARDPHYEVEQGPANALLKDQVAFMWLLFKILNYFITRQSDNVEDAEGHVHHKTPEDLTPTQITLGGHVAHALLMLPLDVIEPVIRAGGANLPPDITLREIFINRFLGFLTRGGKLDTENSAQIDARIAVLDECASVINDKDTVQTMRLQLLMAAKRTEEAYHAACTMLDARPSLGKNATAEEREQDAAKREELQKLIDNIAWSTIPEHLLRKLETKEEAEKLITAGVAALKKFPRAHGLRDNMINLMKQLGQSEQASKLLQEKLALIDDPDEKAKVEKERTTLEATSNIENLLKKAVERVNNASKTFGDAATEQNLAAFRAAVDESLAETQQALAQAKEHNLKELIEPAENFLKQCRDLQAQFQQQAQQVEQQAQMQAIVAQLEALLNSAVQRVNEALATFERDRSAFGALDTLEVAVMESLDEAKQARQLAQQHGIREAVTQADKLIAQFTELQNQINQAR